MRIYRYGMKHVRVTFLIRQLSLQQQMTHNDQVHPRGRAAGVMFLTTRNHCRDERCSKNRRASHVGCYALLGAILG